tara:strand:+ start:358 stop:492 length:135 start_codon:yes stop_codon:yes gene_type:complete
MKRLLLPLLAALTLPTAVLSGVSIEKDAWRQICNYGNGEIYPDK